MKTEKEKYMYWKEQGYSKRDLTSKESRWFETMQDKYDKPDEIKKQMTKAGKKTRKDFTKTKPHYKVKSTNHKRGRRILDQLFGTG